MKRNEMMVYVVQGAMHTDNYIPAHVFHTTQVFINIKDAEEYRKELLQEYDYAYIKSCKLND